jgi:hypothetical protein
MIDLSDSMDDTRSYSFDICVISAISKSILYSSSLSKIDASKGSHSNKKTPITKIVEVKAMFKI